VSFGVANGPKSDNSARDVANGRWWQAVAPYVAGIAALATILSFSGAYDTDELGVGHRIALWLVVSILMIGQPAFLHAIFQKVLASRPFAEIWASGAAVFLSIIIVALELHLLKFTPLLPKAPDPIFEFILFVAPAAGPIAVLVVLGRLMAARRYSAPAMPPGETGDGVQAVAGDFGPEVGDWPASGVETVRARDHYLEVMSEGRRHFVRGRMKAAVERLAGLNGLQVHRSWWVAHESILRIETNGRDKEIVLKSGERIPVARSRLADLRKAGWI